jgi:hypothetical protein
MRRRPSLPNLLQTRYDELQILLRLRLSSNVLLRIAADSVFDGGDSENGTGVEGGAGRERKREFSKGKRKKREETHC